jgi:hypothetical protein
MFFRWSFSSKSEFICEQAAVREVTLPCTRQQVGSYQIKQGHCKGEQQRNRTKGHDENKSKGNFRKNYKTARNLAKWFLFYFLGLQYYLYLHTTTQRAEQHVTFCTIRQPTQYYQVLQQHCFENVERKLILKDVIWAKTVHTVRVSSFRAN